VYTKTITKLYELLNVFDLLDSDTSSE
jgi:hypothetical protein